MSKTTIFYFSGTGNSLAVSKAIAEGLGNTTVVPMVQKDALSKIEGSDRVGIVFPVYVFGMPLIVTRFIKELRLPATTYSFAIAVNGGMPGATIKQAARLFAQNGISLSAGYTVKMVDNYIPLSGAIAPEKQIKRFENAKVKIEAICSAIKNGNARVDQGLPIVNLLFSMIYKGWKAKAESQDKNFTADSNCNGCRTCQRICPVANIEMNNNLPVWKHCCEQCFACLQWCPQKAIQYGKKSSGRTRYHHPEIKLEEMIIPKS